jgi:NADH-quinone oxidoreductase subunit H
VLVFIFMFIWLRGSLPRLRYDQFMHFGWKRLIPIALAWTVLVAGVRAVNNTGGFNRSWLIGVVVVLGVLLVATFFIPEKREPEVDADEPFDAFAGGYPVPPMLEGIAVRGPGTTGTPGTRRSLTTKES